MTSGLSGILTSFDNRGMRSNNPRTSNHKLHAASQALMARFEEEGFPIESKFTNADDVRDYLGGERILCLRCGKPYKALFGHLKVHGWTAEAYKEFYGLPWGSALACEGTISLKRESGIKNFVNGIGLSAIPAEEMATIRAKARKTKARPIAAATKKQATDRLLLLVNRGKILDDASYDAIIELMSARDLTVREAVKVAGTASLTMFFEHRRLNPEFDSRFKRTVEGLSFATQARCGSLGKRFADVCMQRRLEGWGIDQISAETGVSNITIIKATRGFERERNPLCRFGHQKNDKGVCRTCARHRNREKKGFVAREVSAKTLIDATCQDCFASTKVTRLWGTKRPALCDDCKYNRYLASQNKYREGKKGASK